MSQAQIQRPFLAGWAAIRVAGHLLPFALAIVCVLILVQRFSSNEPVTALPLLLGVLCLLAIAYRYYSAFLAAKVAALDDTIVTPAHRFYDGQNYHPTNKWVLFGHHFAAIAGPGPLVGPTLAAQFGLRRLEAGASVALLVDQDVRWEGAPPNLRRVLAPPPPEKLKAIRDLVAGVINFDQNRGDQLVVESLPFEAT